MFMRTMVLTMMLLPSTRQERGHILQIQILPRQRCREPFPHHMRHDPKLLDAFLSQAGEHMALGHNDPEHLDSATKVLGVARGLGVQI